MTALPDRKNARLAVVLTGVAFGMVGMSYAAVPLYQIFCQVTGYGGTTQRAEAPSQTAVDQTITMRFDANTSPALKWTFKPLTPATTIRLGENRMAMFVAKNDTDKPLWGTATFNVSPEAAGVYFNKIECFCFTEQLLQPGESVEMPVSYFIDPDILKDKDAGHLSQLTLSYTFFPLKKDDASQAADINSTAQRNKDAG